MARLILKNSPDLEVEAQKFTCEAFPTGTAALAGAVDILVEAISEDTNTGPHLSRNSWAFLMTSTLKDESLDPKRTFEIYYDFSEKIKNMQGYRTQLSIVGKNWRSKVGFEHHLDRIIRILRLVLKPKMPMWMRLFNKRLRKKSFLRLNVGFGQS